MARRIVDTGKPARRIEDSGKPQRRIEPERIAEALGAELVAEAHSPSLDPIGLAALGSKLARRLRSTGGRPALADATELCRVPLTSEDAKKLEKLAEDFAQRTGAKPSAGQVASIIIHECLSAASGQGKAPLTESLSDDKIRQLREALSALQHSAAMLEGVTQQIAAPAGKGSEDAA